MFVYQQFLIKEADHFDPSVFPQLEDSLQQTLAQLDGEPAGPSTAMILSFVKDRTRNAQQAEAHPRLANLIRSKTLSLKVMEQLFESSRQNPAYQKDLEEYIWAFLMNREELKTATLIR